MIKKDAEYTLISGVMSTFTDCFPKKTYAYDSFISEELENKIGKLKLSKEEALEIENLAFDNSAAEYRRGMSDGFRCAVELYRELVSL